MKYIVENYAVIIFKGGILMKLKRVLYWIYVVYLIINIIYISIPFIMAFARIPESPPFFQLC